MQCLAGEMLEHTDQVIIGAFGNFEPSAISSITDEWKLDVRHMDANLVGAASFQANPNMGVVGKTGQYPIVSNCSLTAVAQHRHQFALRGVAPYRARLPYRRQSSHRRQPLHIPD